MSKSAANGCDAADCAACSVQNGKAACVAGQCAVGQCNGGFADCDKSAQNGCETPLGTSVHCSSCTDVCSAPTGTAACVAGACKITACPSLRADCDGLVGNGCEADLTTPSTCTTCTNKCAPAFDCAKPPTGPHLCACSGDASCLNGGTCYLGICVCGGTPCPGNQRCTLIGTCF
ncbi:MAG: hypothetical protein HS104_30275 [Polyangiaceae bacterium]|nr:hypothetical protein [Polyangiaceae bacterium]